MVGSITVDKWVNWPQAVSLLAVIDLSNATLFYPRVNENRKKNIYISGINKCWNPLPCLVKIIDYPLLSKLKSPSPFFWHP